MNAEHTRLLLLAQHDRLRDHLRTCTRLAQLYAAGDIQVARDLDLSLEVLRAEFAAHNESESAAVRHLLQGPAQWSALMIDRMLEEHVAEHAAFWDLLSGTRSEVVGKIDDLVEELDAHMAAEERTFLAPVTLREDVIQTRTKTR